MSLRLGLKSLHDYTTTLWPSELKNPAKGEKISAHSYKIGNKV